MNERYHHAAKDGYLAPLKQATKKDLNRPDEDGLTPTLWAAYHGNLDALRLCCSRGGDPDKCDYTGNTALHFAASKGHMNCLTFLVSFGANLWQMDNDYHTIMDVASIGEKGDCVRYLDGVIARQQALDKKMVLKLQDKARKDAEKRIKKYQKMQAKQDKKLNSAFEISEDGRRIVQSIRGVRSDRVQNVIYMPGKSSAEDSKVNEGSTSGRRRVQDDAGSLFGTLALRNNLNSANSMYLALDAESNHSYDPTTPRSTCQPTYSTSIGSAGSLSGYDNLSDDEDYMDSDRDVTPLDTFLESQNLSEYSNLFKEENMDIDTLHLCSLEDLKEMGLPLGPRRKIIDALQHREAAIQSPADMDITQI